MEQKFIEPMLGITTALAFNSIGHLINQKGIEDIRPIIIVSLLTCGIGIGAFIVNLVLFIRSKKNK